MLYNISVCLLGAHDLSCPFNTDAAVDATVVAVNGAAIDADVDVYASGCGSGSGKAVY